MRIVHRPARIFITILAFLMVLSSVVPVAVSAPPVSVAAPRAATPASESLLISQPASALPAPSAAATPPQAPLFTEPQIEPPPPELQQEKQGDITLAISVTKLFRAGDLITYTYEFENTTNEVQRNVRIDTTYTNFGTVRNGGGLSIFCEKNKPESPAPCQIAPDSLQLSTPFSVTFEVVGTDTQATGLRLRIPELPAGARGRFQYVFETAFLRYPMSGGAIQTIGSTGNIFVGDTLITNVNRDTFPSGPRFTISKSIVESPSIGRTPAHIFAGESVTFNLVVRNAPLPSDRTTPDVLDAVDVIVRDTIPNGAEFITPTQVLFPFEYRAKENFVLWRLPSLRVGETITIPVTFRMRDTTAECGSMNNRIATVTSSQLPLDDRLTTPVEFPYLTVNAAPSAVRVQTPLLVTAKADPGSIPPGERSRITFEVSNYYLDADVEDIKLIYDIQPGAYYVTNTATMSNQLTTIPPDDLPGQRIAWTFDISRPTSLDKPTKLAFSVEITATEVSIGFVQIVPTKDTKPASLPRACLLPVRAGVIVALPVDTIIVTKRPALPPQDFKGAVGLVQQGDTVRYVIEVQNTSDVEVQGFELIDRFPSNSLENPNISGEFTFIEGTALPNISDFSEEGGGTLLWRNILLPPGITTFEYTVKVEGLEFFTYCNSAAGSLPEGQTGFIVNNRPGTACVKISPQIKVFKIADVKQALPGQEVRFTLSLVNNSSTTHTLSLADRFVEGDFEFVRVDPDRTYGNPPQRSVEQNYEVHSWDMVDLPPGGRLDAAFFARLLGETCIIRNRAYLNEALFIYESKRLPGEPYGVLQIPNDESAVQIQCLNRQLEFSVASLQAAPSLQTTFGYRLDIVNKNLAEPANNVTVRQILPLGFIYEGPSAVGDLRERPSQRTLPDGRIELTWLIPSIAANKRFIIQYIARAGQTVGPQITEMRVSTTDTRWRITCRAGPDCIPAEDGTKIGTTRVNVQALLTASPRLIKPERCLNIGEPLEYVVSLVNTDSSRTYEDVTVGLTLSLGLNYVGVFTGTNEPTIKVSPNGETIINWSDLNIERPAAGRQIQRDFRIKLQVGGVLGELLTRVDVRTPDGLVPIKQGDVDPNVAVCDDRVTDLTLLKEINPRRTPPGGSFVYLITLANNNEFAVNATVREQLPTAFTFAEVLTDSAVTSDPTINGGVLEWRNVTIPARNGTTPGITEIRFRVRVSDQAELNTYSSSTQVSRIFPSEVPIPDPVNSPEVRVAFENLVYLPFVRR